MRILFVWPNKDQWGFKPIGISLLSQILKNRGHQVELFDTTYIDFGFKTLTEAHSQLKIFKEVDFSGYDTKKKKVSAEEEFLEKLRSFEPDVVGVSALSDEVQIGMRLSETAKKFSPRIQVIWGNKTATMATEKILSNPCVDWVCRGEGFYFITEFVDFLSKNKDPRSLDNIAYREKGRFVKNKLRPYYQDLDSLPFVDWSIFDERHFLKPFNGKIYRGADHMIYWGCPNQCTYCINSSYRKLYGKEGGRFLRRYSVPRIIRELIYLKAKWGIEFLKFHDEDFCLKPMNYFNELAEEYAKHIAVPFTAMANPKNIDGQKVRLLKKMNCVSISIGIETGNNELRTKVLKRTDTPEEIVNAVKLLKAAGIRTVAFNMLGLPFETRQTIMDTVRLNRLANVEVPESTFFFPLENTPLRDIAVNNGFYDPKSEGVFQTDNTVLTFPNLTNREVLKLRERFLLYVKLPEELYKYIERSEKDDQAAVELTKRLSELFEKYVFGNNGFWNESADLLKIMGELDKICRLADFAESPETV